MVKLSLTLALALVAAAPARGGVDVLVGRYDLRGGGANLRETVLNTANVNPGRFGKLFSYEVEGAVYAQPLIVSGLPVRGRVRNVLYVATTNGLVYALDADDPGPDGGLLWQVRLTDRGALPAPSVKTAQTVQGNIGILSTPFIDRGRGIIYVVARSLGPDGFRQRLHALDFVTGSERPPSPVDIAPAAIVRDGLTFKFDPAVPSNRAGLTMSGASLVVAWAGLDDDHGWVMSFDADTLQRTGIFCTSCARSVPTTNPLDCSEPQKQKNEGRVPPWPWLIGAGIWQSGRPPVVDAQGHVYVFAGNGWTHGCIGKRAWYFIACEEGQTFQVPLVLPGTAVVLPFSVRPQPKPPGYYGESLVRLDPRNGLALVGSWTPANWCWLDHQDFDLGGSGPALIDFGLAGGAVRTFAVGGGKEGRLYSIDTEAVTHPDGVEGFSMQALHGNFDVVRDAPTTSCPGGSTPAQRLSPHHIMGGPVIWPRARAGAVSVFVSEESDCVRGFALAPPGTTPSQLIDLIQRQPITATAQVIEGHPGAILTLSADGDTAGTGILWMTYGLNPPQEDATFDTRRGQLAAYDAENLSRQLWHSDMAAGQRDALGYFAKFNPPTVANGKVYAASFPPPEPYKTVLMEDKREHTYTARNNIGYVVVYGLGPPAKAPVRSFAAEALQAILAPLLEE
jgi:hypothetical protein